jgi:phosphohistidine phosphatase SixA
VQALRRGGFNLYMRHAQSSVGQDGNLQLTPFWWENCTLQRNMSDVGREQARKVGAALRELTIPVDQVLTAQFCRTRETGHLLGLGPVEVTEDLNHQIGQRTGFDVNAARFRRLAETPAKGRNNLLISHTHGSQRAEERIMSGIQEAEIVVFQPDGKGGTAPVARIPVPEWGNLIKAMAATKS